MLNEIESLKEELAEQEAEKLALVQENARLVRFEQTFISATQALADGLAALPDKISSYVADAMPAPAPLLEEAVPAAGPGKCQNEFGPCIDHCGQCKPAADWFPPTVFDSKAEYNASVAENVGRVERGEVKPIEPQPCGCDRLHIVNSDDYRAGAGFECCYCGAKLPASWPIDRAALPTTGEGKEPISGGKEVAGE